MNRYKPVGWRNEAYRHSLAARGCRTAMAGNKSRLVDLRYGPTLESSGIATAAQINSAYKNEDIDSNDILNAIEDRKFAKEQVANDIIYSNEISPPEKALPSIMGPKIEERFDDKGSDGLHITYLPVNNAYAIMWGDEIINIWHTKHDAEDHLRDIRRRRDDPESL
jgi:hypothetical protein